MRPVLIFTPIFCFPSKLIFTHSPPCGCHAAVDIKVAGRASLIPGPLNPFRAPSEAHRTPGRQAVMLCPVDFTLHCVQASLTKKWGIWPRLKAATQAFPRTTGQRILGVRSEGQSGCRPAETQGVTDAGQPWVDVRPVGPARCYRGGPEACVPEGAHLSLWSAQLHTPELTQGTLRLEFLTCLPLQTPPSGSLPGC